MKACPFCGSHDTSRRTSLTSKGERVRVVCNECDARGPVTIPSANPHDDSAAFVWNIRSAPQPRDLRPMIQDLRDALGRLPA